MSPTTREWSRLIEAAVRVKQLGPWKWMLEDEIFDIAHEDRDELEDGDRQLLRNLLAFLKKGPPPLPTCNT
jgi:hypothetical protein